MRNARSGPITATRVVNPTMNDALDVTDNDRIDAYEKLMQASGLMDEAARLLGFENVHDMHGVDESELTGAEVDALRAITNAHSYLNNGDVAEIYPDFD